MVLGCFANAGTESLAKTETRSFLSNGGAADGESSERTAEEHNQHGLVPEEPPS